MTFYYRGKWSPELGTKKGGDPMSPAGLIALGCPEELAKEICRVTDHGESATVGAAKINWSDLWRLLSMLASLGPAMVPLVQQLIAAIQAKDIPSILSIIQQIVVLVQGGGGPIPGPSPGA